jgi:hypothetical protein
MAVELVMSYIVLPLSALRSRGPYELHDVILGLLVHMVVVGLLRQIGVSVGRRGRIVRILNWNYANRFGNWQR